MAAERTHDAPVFAPRVDIIEGERQVVLLADLPGVDESSVSIDLVGTELTIKGTSVCNPPEGVSLSLREYESGDYERSFTLGETIARDQIKATVRDGVLRLILPKAESSQPRRIAVKAG